MTTSRGYLGIVTCLMQQGADIHGDTDLAIRWSARNGHSEVIKYLMNVCALARQRQNIMST